MWALYRFESNWKVTKPKLKCTLHILTNAFDLPLKLQLTLLKHLEKRTKYIKIVPSLLIVSAFRRILNTEKNVNKHNNLPTLPEKLSLL